MNSSTSIPAALTKKLAVSADPSQKITSEAVQLTAELLRKFIVEARQRAAIEAECENEGNLIDLGLVGNDAARSATESIQIPTPTVSVRADHVTKVAAELLMDFS